MNRALLSYAQLKDYLITAAESDLPRYDADAEIFKTTEKCHIS